MEKIKFENNPEVQEPQIYKDARLQINMEVYNSQSSQEAVDKLLERLETFFKYIDKELLPEEKINEIKNSFLDCVNIEDKEILAESLFENLKPLLDIKEKHPEKYEEFQAKAMNEHGNFIEINRLLSYGKDDGIIHIHAPAGRSVENKFSLYRQGMRDLAKIVEADPEVTKITATSYIVAEHPELFTIMGFGVHELSPKKKKNISKPIPVLLAVPKLVAKIF